MKLFSIRDKELGPAKDLAYLLYYEKAKTFYIEIPEETDEWEAPLLLSSFIRRGRYSLDAYWSRQWVRQRLIPPERQNLGMVLKANGLKEYDEYSLLLLGKGRCAQDNCYLVPLKEAPLPKLLQQRQATKLEEIIPLKQNRLLAFFRNGRVKRISLEKLVEENQAFAPVLKNAVIFDSVQLLPGGYGIGWGENLQLSDTTLYNEGATVPLELADFLSFVEKRVISSSEATDLLGCSRQNLNKLIKEEKIHPLKQADTFTLFRKNEIEVRV